MSPLRWAPFCSAFADVDAPFGSLGCGRRALLALAAGGAAVPKPKPPPPAIGATPGGERGATTPGGGATTTSGGGSSVVSLEANPPWESSVIAELADALRSLVASRAAALVAVVLPAWRCVTTDSCVS